MASAYSTNGTVTSNPPTGSADQFRLEFKFVKQEFSFVTSFDKMVVAFRSEPGAINVFVNGELGSLGQFSGRIGGGLFEVTVGEVLRLYGPIEGGPLEPVVIQGNMSIE